MTVLAITVAVAGAVAYLLMTLAFIGLSVGELAAKGRLGALTVSRAIIFGLFWPITLVVVFSMAARPVEKPAPVPFRPRSVHQA